MRAEVYDRRGVWLAAVVELAAVDVGSASICIAIIIRMSIQFQFYTTTPCMEYSAHMLYCMYGPIYKYNVHIAGDQRAREAER